jgi:tetratricopeptide (TPR) repeat protein
MKRASFSAAVLIFLFCGVLLAERPEDLIEKGQFDAACPLLEAALKKEPHSDRLKMGLVLCLLLRRDSRDYPSDLRQSLRLLEESILLYQGIPGEEKALAWRNFHAGMALWYLNQSEQALAAFDRAFRFDPALHQALYNSITILEELGRYEEARLRKEIYIRIAAIDPF